LLPLQELKAVLMLKYYTKKIREFLIFF